MEAVNLIPSFKELKAEYVTDRTNTRFVKLPEESWNMVMKMLREFTLLEQFRLDARQAMQEAMAIERGEIEDISLEEFMNEL